MMHKRNLDGLKNIIYLC